MIGCDGKDIVAVRRTMDDGRIALFTSTDVRPYWGQRFWRVVLDNGDDGIATQVRYGTACTAPSGWTVRQLICVVQARMAIEYARAPDSGALAVLQALGAAVRQMPEGDVLGNGVEFGPGGPASPYAWTVAWMGDQVLPLCPDPESRQAGITPELLLIVLDQMLKDWSGRTPYLHRLWTCRNAIRDALAAEIRRVRIVRGEPESSGRSA